jgi:hypothetical protein
MFCTSLTSATFLVKLHIFVLVVLVIGVVLINQSGICPLAFNLATLPLSPAQLDVPTNTAVSVKSISKSICSFHPGFTLVPFIQSP